MKKYIILLSFIFTLGLCVYFSGIVKAYSNLMHLNLNNDETYTSPTENISVSYSDSLIHSIVMYGSDASSVNNICITLQRQTVFWIWGNAGYAIYTTNDLFTYTFGNFPNGKFRFIFDADNYPYQGRYNGDFEHFAV